MAVIVTVHHFTAVRLVLQSGLYDLLLFIQRYVLLNNSLKVNPATQSWDIVM